MSNHQGNTTMIGLLLLFLFSAYLLFFILTWQQSLKHLSVRAKTYLCFKNIAFKTKQHIQRINRLNWFILQAHRLKLLTSVFPALAGVKLTTEGARQILQKTQDLLQLQYWGFLLTQKSSCPLSVLAWLTPYQSSGPKLQRSPDHTVSLRSNPWNLILTSSALTLKGSFHFQDHLSPKHRLEVQEQTLALGFWKGWSGSGSFPASWPF